MIHIIDSASNRHAHKWSAIRGVFDFFFPIGNFLRCEAITAGKERHFYTFRAFIVHYFYEFFIWPIRNFKEAMVLTPNFGRIGAVAFDVVTDGGFSAATTSKSFAHVVTGTNNIVFCGVYADANNITGITYNSVALAEIAGAHIDFAAPQAGQVNELWYLVNPSTGSNTMTVSLSPAAGVYPVGASYSGVNQVAPEASNKGTNAGSHLTVAVLTITDNAWVVMSIRNNSGTNFTADSGTTIRLNNPGSGGAGWADSGGPVSPPQSYTLGVTYTNDGNQKGGSAAAIAPTGGVVAVNHLRMRLGVGK